MENSPVARDKDELRAKILRMRSRDKWIHYRHNS